MNDPMSVVATLAHELCHFHLLGGRRVTSDEPDHEPLTDLAVIYFGFGVFAANSSFRSRSYSYGQWHYTSMKRQGYLPPPVLGYGLALYAWLREETSPSWVRYVRADVCEPMRKALAFLGSSGAPALGLDGNPPLDPPELSQDLLERLGLPAVDGSEGDTQDRLEPERDHEDVASLSDEAFTDATIALNAGQYEEAANLFQKVVNDQPEDGEAYAQLAAVQLKMSRPAEAVAAASKAIEISPDDGDALQIRGSAYLELGRCQDAVNDLENCASNRVRTQKDRIGLRQRHICLARRGHGSGIIVRRSEIFRSPSRSFPPGPPLTSPEPKSTNCWAKRRRQRMIATRPPSAARYCEKLDRVPPWTVILSVYAPPVALCAPRCPGCALTRTAATGPASLPSFGGADGGDLAAHKGRRPR